MLFMKSLKNLYVLGILPDKEFCKADGCTLGFSKSLLWIRIQMGSDPHHFDKSGSESRNALPADPDQFDLLSYPILYRQFFFPFLLKFFFAPIVP
jgi:hypothetical protein